MFNIEVLFQDMDNLLRVETPVAGLPVSPEFLVISKRQAKAKKLSKSVYG